MTLAWWLADAAADRFVTDLVSYELKRERPGWHYPAMPWHRDWRLDGDEIGCDSLELLSLAAALAQALHLHRSGIEDLLLARRRLTDWAELSRMGLARFSDEITFSTSGSTGDPKLCTHRLADLVEEAGELAYLLSGTRRIVAAVPSCHIYGFIFTLLLPALLKVPVLAMNGSSALSVIQAADQEGDLIIGYPDFWRAALRSVENFPRGLSGVTSTGPIDDELGRHLKQKGLAHLLDVYGSSETSGIGWRELPASTFRAFSYWRPGALSDQIFRASEDGTLRAFPLQDHLTLAPDGGLVVGSRRDRAFQVGGINVHPGHVEKVLAEHPAIHQAQIRQMSPGEGGRVKAFVIPNDPHTDAEALRAELLRWCRSRLSAAECPRHITVGTAFSTNELGKRMDWVAA